MRNGDISNKSFEIVVLLDGNGVLYHEVGGWWKRLMRKLAYRLRSERMMLNLVQVDRKGLSLFTTLFWKENVRIGVMAFSCEEEFVLRDCMFQHLGFERCVVIIRNEEDFRMHLDMCNLMMSNQYGGVNAAAKRYMYQSVEQVVNQIGADVSFGRSRR